MSIQLLKQLKLKLIPNSSVTVSQVNGITQSIGRVTSTMTIGKANPISRQVSLHVMENFRYPLLIGLDIGELFDLQIDVKRRKVYRPQNSRPTKYVALHLDTESNRSLDVLLRQNEDVFSQHETDIGRITIARHHITTVPHPPITLRPYRRPQHEYDEINKQIEELKKMNLVKDSVSPWAFPVVLQPKKDGSQRLCVDYRKLNSITIDDKMPLPHIHEVIDRLQGAKYFTTLDIAWGYWHVEMDPKSTAKTAFVTNQGHYEWLVMPFGLKNAPATFQRIIQAALSDLLYKGAINYLDDIIIYSATFEEHISLLQEAFKRLRQHNIKLKLSKCYFVKPEVEYLGHIISFNTVKPSPRKIEAVKQFPMPKTVREVRRFLGLTGYYRRFINHFSIIAKPLSDLTKKSIPFHWSHDQQTAFETLRDAIIQTPVIAMFDPDKQCSIFTDASKIGIGAILTQKDEQNNDRVIAYYSKRLNPTQENYSASELECLAVVEAVEHFDNYLHQPFKIITDHSALKWLLNFKNPKSRLFRWSIRLSTKNFEIIHRSGSKQQHVDALSRSPLSLHLDIDELREAQKKSDMSFIKQPHVRNNITTIRHNGLYKAYVPDELRQTLLQKFHENFGHPGINKTIKLITPYYWWPDIRKDIRKHVASCKTCQLAKTRHLPELGKFTLFESDIEPLEVVGIDTIDLGASAAKTRHKYIQVVIDHMTRYVWAVPTASNSAAAIKTVLSDIFKTVGPFGRIITDQAKNFKSRELKDFLNTHKVKHSFSSSYHPQTNGIVEKANGTIIEKLRAAMLDRPKCKWSTLLKEVVHKYNSTPHDITGFSPRYLLLGIEETPTFASPALKIDEARKLANERTNRFRNSKKASHDLKHKHLEFEVGDKVVRKIASNHPSLIKTSPRYEGPLTIIRKLSPVTYDVSTGPNENVSRAHISQLSPFVARQQIQQPGENEANTENKTINK
jgi:transposase InsO family protein